MSSLRVQVDADVADALQAECELLGFDGPEAYLAWIVENRAAIEQGTEAKDLLGAYRDRLAALEARLAAEGVDPDEVAGDADLVPSPADAETAVETRPSDDGTTSADDGAPAADDDATAADDGTPLGDDADGAAAVADGAGAEAAGGAGTTTADAAADAPSASDPDAEPDPESAAEPDPESDGRPDPGRTAATSADAATSGDDTAAADGFDVENLRKGDESVSASEASDGSDAAPEPTAASDGGTTTSVADVTSMHLRPERVQRVNEDPVARDAGELADVETQRVDELSRKAVAETRDQLDRDVQTGLSYSSSTELPGSDVRPGEDVADLDEIDVPGRSEDVVTERREVVGRALAFLRDEGRARRSDVVEALYEDHPAGYETADGWWRCVREGLGQVEAVDGGRVWEYVG